MSSDNDGNGDENGVPTNGSSDNGAISPDDPRVTPLGGNAGVHVREEEDDAEPSETRDEERVPIDFGGFIVSLGTSCMVNLGKQPNPETGKTERDLPAARQTIDIIEMLRDKTRGNLDNQEQQLLTTLLHDLRKAYNEVGE